MQLSGSMVDVGVFPDCFCMSLVGERAGSPTRHSCLILSR